MTNRPARKTGTEELMRSIATITRESERPAQTGARDVWVAVRQRLEALWKGRCARRARRLRLCETLALGERRFLAVVEFERQRFLIGSTSGSVALLSRLPEACEEAEAGDSRRRAESDAGGGWGGN